MHRGSAWSVSGLVGVFVLAAVAMHVRVARVAQAGEEVVHRVTVADGTFVPREVRIFAGDRVGWEHDLGREATVTNGTGSADPRAGELFDAPLSAAAPRFERRFTASGVVPYFSRPQEALGMRGYVLVQELFPRGDANADGALDITDAVVILTSLFLGREARGCDDALDANDDGEAGLADAIFLLELLFRNGSGLPDPYPSAGPDRTDDALLCLDAELPPPPDPEPDPEPEPAWPLQSWFPKAPPLAPPAGEVVHVRNTGELLSAVENALPGRTVLVADGHYFLPRYFEIRVDGLTLRGASGARERVILDGTQSRHGELLGIRGASDVNIADLTVQNVQWNGIKINSETGVHRLTVHNCVIHNVWQRGVKGVRVPEEGREALRPKDSTIEYCLFYNDRPKQFSDDPADTAENFNGNYIGGIDVMYVRNWRIRDNVFVGIRGRTGGARGAIFVWNDSHGTTIERNIIIDCDTGIALGNSHRREDVTTHCTGFIVRNNFVSRAPESGILADYTRDCRVLHNTVQDPDSGRRRLIRIVHDAEGLMVENNLLYGAPVRVESESPITLRTNVVTSDGSIFANAERGNLHLRIAASGVAGQAARLAEVPEDIDRAPRDASPDVGADEL